MQSEHENRNRSRAGSIAQHSGHQELLIFAKNTPSALEVSLPGPARTLQHRQTLASPVLPLTNPH